MIEQFKGGTIHVSAVSPQFLKDAVDKHNWEFAREHGLDHIPATWNADSRDGTIKGCEDNCVLIALSDSGALNTKFWLDVVADAPGSTLKEFALRHPKGSFLVDYLYPERPDRYPAQSGNDHYSAMVDGVLYNASNSAPDSKVNYAFEVLHVADLEARGVDPNGPVLR